jgi:hypothetical protein
LHALLYLLSAGIGWDYLPKSLPSPRTVQDRLEGWLALDHFYAAWRQLGQRCGRLSDVSWDQVLPCRYLLAMDAPERLRPTSRAARRRGRLRWVAVRVASSATDVLSPE